MVIISMMVKVHGLRNKDLKNACHDAGVEMDQDLGNDTRHVSRVTRDIVRCLSFVAAPSPVVPLLTSPLCSLVVLSSIVPALHVWEECEHRSGSRHWR